MKFVYCFGEDEKDCLVARGYNMLKSDNLNSVYIFENKNELKFSDCEMQSGKIILSNTLTF